VPNLGDHRFLSPQIVFDAPTPWIYGTIGGKGTSVGDGYFVLIQPLERGQHVIHYGGAFRFTPDGDGFEDYWPMEMTYFITVP
jgi:hypothetical protein